MILGLADLLSFRVLGKHVNAFLTATVAVLPCMDAHKSAITTVLPSS